MNEKIIKGLQYYIENAKECVFKTDCPYGDDCKANDYAALARDALQAIEPHLLTREDFVNADKYGWLPVWTQTKTDLYCECVKEDALDEEHEYEHRMWVGKPTDEQLESEWET